MSWFRRHRSGDESVLLLCFALGEEFLSHRLFPDAKRLWVAPERNPEDLTSEIPAGCALAILCLNLSEPRRLLPSESPLRHALAARGIPLLNSRVGDLTKHGLRATLTAAGLPTTAADLLGPPDELLIVKANHNSGAQIERSLDAGRRARLGLPPIPDHVPENEDYKVLPRRDLTAAEFDDPLLSVDRFLPREDRIVFRIFVAGRHAQLCVRRSAATIARGGNSSVVHNVLLVETDDGWEGQLPSIPDLPAVLTAGLQAAHATGLDLGSLDLVTDAAGRAYVIDVNATSHCGSDVNYGGMMAHLRAGLRQPALAG